MILNIWRVTDGRSGHDSQSTGLCQAIANLTKCKQYDIPVISFFDYLKNLILKKFPYGADLPNPDLIIGAGHKTHLAMLSARQVRKGKIIVLMRPTLPLSFFDICIVPKHDTPPKNNNIILSNGAINTLKYNEKKQEQLGVILIGGPSKHYRWDNESIIEQINAVVTICNDINWTISNSPRTPQDLMSKILKLHYKNADVLDYKNDTNKKVRKLIFLAKNIWITPDSVSMIYESLTSGASVGLFDLRKSKKNRINNSIDSLISDNIVVPFIKWEKKNKLPANNLCLDEAGRCAKIILDKII
tara:strand:+ start:1142 stop:2044 length:903 start_codon:yes stop_codon:yes gene_type:complete